MRRSVALAQVHCSAPLYWPDGRARQAKPGQDQKMTAQVARERTPSVGFVSLGCPKALVDSERLITELRARGYQIAAQYAQADLVVVNTCGLSMRRSTSRSMPSARRWNK